MHWIPRFHTASPLPSFESFSSREEKKFDPSIPLGEMLANLNSQHKKNVSSTSLSHSCFCTFFLFLFLSFFPSLLYWLYCYSSDADALTTASNTLNVPSWKHEWEEKERERESKISLSLSRHCILQLTHFVSLFLLLASSFAIHFFFFFSLCFLIQRNDLLFLTGFAFMSHGIERRRNKERKVTYCTVCL